MFHSKTLHNNHIFHPLEMTISLYIPIDISFSNELPVFQFEFHQPVAVYRYIRGKLYPCRQMENNMDAVFRTYPLFLPEYGNFRSGSWHSLCSPVNQNDQKIYILNFFTKKVDIGDQSSILSLIMKNL